MIETDWITVLQDRDEARAMARRLAAVLAQWNFDQRAPALAAFEALDWAKEPA